ncbi:MAG: SelT/SelW/SelH family protein [Deltaproteobacteria bacterium]|nr:SelT/SelW/SelH family protein [Deltaproteobacteria bacterium]
MASRVEAELTERYPDARIRLIESGGGVFDVECDGRLIFSKQKIAGQRFPEEREIIGLIEQEKS